MAVCAEESVSTVHTKRLNKRFDIKEVKCVECSFDSSFLLVQKLDGTLYVVYTNSGQVHLACRDVQQFVWSKPQETVTGPTNATFAILQSNGDVEVFEIKERSKARKQSSEDVVKEKTVVNVGSLTLKTIGTLLASKGEACDLKNLSLIHSKQRTMSSNDGDKVDLVTLLFDGYLLVTLSFGLLSSPEVSKCFEMIKHVSVVPFLLPKNTISDLKMINEMLFILFECGVILLYNLVNWTFHGWIDVFIKIGVSDESGETSTPDLRPVARILDITEDKSLVFICDDANNVTEIDLASYYQHFPSHLVSSRGRATASGQDDVSSRLYENNELIENDPSLMSNLFGDLTWRSELFALSRDTERCRKPDEKSEWKSVKRKSCEKEQSEMSSETPWCIVVESPLWMKDFTCVGLFCSSSSFLLWLLPTRKEEDQQLDNGVLCCYSKKENDYLVNVFVEETCVVSGGEAIRPVYLLTSNMIGLAVFGTSQNELVNKIIMYENVAMAEKLCHLNDWDHFAVPISALEAALKHEQLDTVAFYLKTKGKAFTTIASETEVTSPVRTFSPLSLGSFHSKQLYSKSAQSEDLLDQITGVVNLLLNTLTTSSKRKHSVQFTRQLLQMSFDYVNGLMLDAVNKIERHLGTDNDREKIQQIVSFLTAKTMDLRLFSHSMPPFITQDARRNTEQDRTTEEDAPAPGLCSEAQEIIFKKWSTMDDTDVIEDAILSRLIPVAQLYFLSKGQTYTIHDGSLFYFIKSGMNLVLEALASRNISTGTRMLQNMGENEVEVIKNICMKTFDRPLRDFLVEQLMKWNELSPGEISAVSFLKSLESLYDSQSFESCKIRQLQHDAKFSDLGLLQTSPPKKNESFKTGSIAPGHHGAMASRDSGCYCEVLLDWVMDWDDETRERILLEMLLHEKKEFWSQVSEQSCWQYFKAHSDTARITQWISATSGKSPQQDCPPLSLKVSCDLSQCTRFVRGVILDELTRNELYSQELLQQFPLLLRQLCRTGKLFSNVHPFDEICEKDCQSLLKTLRESGTESVHNMSLFHEKMVEYCSRHDFMNLLFYYLDFYRLFETSEDCQELVQRNVNQDVDMLLQFRLAGLYPSDPSVIYAMSFSNSCIILNTDCSTVQNMLSNGRPIMAIATCLYAPVDLSQMLTRNTSTVNSGVWQLEEASLKTTLTCYPRLLSALFPRTASQVLKENPDINLYELLQGNCPFELSTLFSWQSTNTMTEGEGLLTDMPHFSQKDLVEKFAHNETLTYWYFLKHGRPSFAFLTFLSKHQHRKYIPKTSVSKATNKAYQLAVTHFTNRKIVNSCVAFLELLAVDTSFVRIDVEVARRIIKHGEKDSLQCNSQEELKNVIVKHLLKWIKDKRRKPKPLLVALEIATRNLISKEGLDRSSRQACEFWSLSIMFCRSHNLPLTPAFLIDAAKADKWLTFLCHAQLAQFPKNQVLSVVQHHFEQNHVKEHLHHALINVVTIDMKDAARRRKKSAPTRRDVRSQYLSRVIGASPVSPKSEHVLKSHDNDPPSEPELSEQSEQSEQLTPEVEPETKKDSEDEDDDNENEFEIQDDETTSNVIDINPETSPNNLFDVLSLCNETTESWRAILAHGVALKRPLFAVLAACYKDVSLVDCICVWLCSVHDLETLDPALVNISDVQWHHWTQDDLLSLILTISKHGSQFAHFLSKAFYLFDPNNLLLPLMRFYEAFRVHLDLEAAGNQLSDFVTRHKSLCVTKNGGSEMLIGDLGWCEKVANGVVENMLRSCQTIHTQVDLLRLLCHCKFGNAFSLRVADFKKLYRVSQVLEEGSVFAQCIDLTSDNEKCERILEELLSNRKFAQAKKYTSLVGIPSDTISLRQVIQKKTSMQTSRLWANERERIAFWESCDRYLEEQECAGAGQFFEEESKASSLSTHEKATLLCIAYNWFSGRRNDGRTVSKTPVELAELEHETWLCIIHDRMNSEGGPRGNFAYCKSQSSLTQEGSLGIEGDETQYITDVKMKKALEEIIGELLDEGQVTQARRLSVIFGTSTTDLDIVLACIFLAQEMLCPENLDESIKCFLTPRQKSSLSNSLKTSGGFMESLSHSSQKSSEESGSEEISSWAMVSDNLAAMENLTACCHAGRRCCSQVIIAYKICQTLGLTFDKVVNMDNFDLLCSLLGSSFDQRYKLAAHYIKSFDLDNEKVAQFVSQSISMSLKVYSGAEISEDKVLIFNPSSKEDMTHVIGLAEDKLILGGVLFEEALVLAKRRKSAKPSSSALMMEVELLICAHRCQSLACNTEGISSILKMAQFCTNALAEANEYQLMVRLLTGIGRFTEMTYIFQTLMDHHHFELLIQKNIDNESKLKIALLNYLDKHYMDDTEKHWLVALRFNMHREVAMSLKTSADSQVKALVQRGSLNEAKAQLLTIAQSYCYAMENFKEEGCLLQALECAKLRRLVELQSRLLPTGMVILGLNSKSLGEFLAKYNNFFEGYIVADAYNKRSIDTWIEPLFIHVILGGDFKYFNEVCSVFQVSASLLSEIVTRYRNELQRNVSAMTNMKKLVHCEKDVVSRYKLAVELGYRDEVESIRQSEAGALVRDLIGQ